MVHIPTLLSVSTFSIRSCSFRATSYVCISLLTMINVDLAFITDNRYYLLAASHCLLGLQLANRQKHTQQTYRVGAEYMHACIEFSALFSFSLCYIRSYICFSVCEGKRNFKGRKCLFLFPSLPKSESLSGSQKKFFHVLLPKAYDDRLHHHHCAVC